MIQAKGKESFPVIHIKNKYADGHVGSLQKKALNANGSGYPLWKKMFSPDRMQ